MTTLPAKRSTSSPQPADPDLRLTLSVLTARIGWFGARPSYIGAPPGPNARAALSARLGDLNEALGYRDKRKLERALAAVFSLTKTANDDRGRAADLIEDYAGLLSVLPTWAVVEACERIARGRGKSDTFAPAAPEIHRLAESIARPWEDERAKISTVLSAETEERADPVKSARVTDGFQKLSASLGAFERKSA